MMANLNGDLGGDESSMHVAAPIRATAEPKGKAVVGASSSGQPQMDPPSRRRPQPATTVEEEEPQPVSEARTSRASTPKRRRMVPRVAG